MKNPKRFYEVLICCMFCGLALAVFLPSILFTLNIPDRERVQVSTVQEISTINPLLSNKVTLLTLGNGTTIRLAGKFDGWTRGEAVSKPVIKKGNDADSDDQIRELDQVWCVGNKCLHQD